MDLFICKFIYAVAWCVLNYSPGSWDRKCALHGFSSGVRYWVTKKYDSHVSVWKLSRNVFISRNHGISKYIEYLGYDGNPCIFLAFSGEKICQ